MYTLCHLSLVPLFWFCSAGSWGVRSHMCERTPRVRSHMCERTRGVWSHMCECTVAGVLTIAHVQSTFRPRSRLEGPVSLSSAPGVGEEKGKAEEDEEDEEVLQALHRTRILLLPFAHRARRHLAYIMATLCKLAPSAQARQGSLVTHWTYCSRRRKDELRSIIIFRYWRPVARLEPPSPRHYY